MTAVSLRRVLAIILLLVTYAIGFGYAQESLVSTIVGQVTDESHAAVPDAVVHVTNVDTNAERTTNSGQHGEFSVLNLLPARYKISAEKTGFSICVIEPFDLRVGETAGREWFGR